MLNVWACSVLFQLWAWVCSRLSPTGIRMSFEITRFYLPPDRGDLPALRALLVLLPWSLLYAVHKWACVLSFVYSLFILSPLSNASPWLHSTDNGLITQLLLVLIAISVHRVLISDRSERDMGRIKANTLVHRFKKLMSPTYYWLYLWPICNSILASWLKN